MKNQIVWTAIFLCMFTTTVAQEPFQQAFKTKFPFKIEGRSSNKDQTIIYGRSNQGVCALSATDGSVMWNINFEKSFGEKEFEFYRNLEYSGVLLFYTKGSKKTPSQKLFIDAKTGNLLWKTSEFGLGADFEKGLSKSFDKEGVFAGDKGDGLKLYSLRTGEYVSEILTSAATQKNMIYFDNQEVNGLFIELSYEDKAKAATTSGTKSQIELVATDISTAEVKWRSSFEAAIVATVCWNSLFAGSWTGVPLSDVVLDWEINGNQLFVYSAGIYAFDLSTGKLQWQSTYSNTKLDFGLKLTQVFNIASKPVITNEAVYFADLSKDVYTLKKLNRLSGEIVWKSEELKKSDIVPAIHVSNNQLICQFGGVQVQQIAYDGNCRSTLAAEGEFGLRAYDLNSGKLNWKSNGNKALKDDFSKTIGNVLVASNVAYAYGSEYFMALNASNGDQKFATELKSLKIGKPIGMTWLNGNNAILIRAEKGLACINAQDGKVIYTTKLPMYLGEFIHGDYFFVWIGKAEDDVRDFAAVDLKTGAITGIQKDTPYPDFEPNGHYFLKYDGETVYRFNVK